MTADLNEMGPVVDSVERKSFTDIIDLRPEVRLRFDKMKYSVGAFETAYDPANQRDSREDFTKKFTVASSVRFRLNMRANVLNDVFFNGRLVMQHSTQSNERLCILSDEIKSSGSITGIDFDRAYFDYRMHGIDNYPIILSFGVLPTSGGTPMQYAERIGHKTFIRGIVAQAYTLDPNIYPYQCNRETIDNANIYGLYFDTHVSDNILFSIGVNVLDNLKAHPYLGPDITANNADNLGTMVTFGMGVDAERVADSGVTTFLHMALSNPHANGNIDDYGPGTDGNFTDSAYATGPMLSSNGYSLYTGLLYDLRRSWTLGAEYNYGSKYWFAATQGAEDMFNKLATRGHVGEGYLIWEFNRHMFAKAGYMYTKEAYTGSGWHFGEPIKKDGTQQVGYLQLNASF